MFKKKKPLIEFVSTIDGLENIEDCVPKPHKAYVPNWFKNMPSFSEDIATIKNCPSFPDLFSQGYVIPMWATSKLIYSKEHDIWQAKNLDGFNFWDFHSKKQFLNHTPFSYMGVDGSFIFKANCPWRIITPPGWSVLQLPLFYHFDKKFTVLPGIIDTDIHHEINQQVAYFGNSKEIIIERGEPLALYIPFERKKYSHVVRSANEKDKKNFFIGQYQINSVEKGSGEYRKMQRKRDKNG